MPAARKPRVDVERNRQALLAAALPLLTDPDADSSPAAVAKAAGVGVGTLYRHFPTREALAEAVYRDDLRNLCQAAAALVEEHPAAEALRLWLQRCVEHTYNKHGMAEALHAATAAGADPYSDSRKLLVDAIALLLRRGAADGTLRQDRLADDILIAFSGLVTASHEYGDRAQALRLVDILMDALAVP